MNPRMLKLWGAAAASNLADGVFQVGLALLTVRLTRSPAEVSGIQLAARLPWLLLALHAGVLADRVERRRLLLGTSVGRIALVGGLAVLMLFGLERIELLYALAFALGIAETLFDTTVHAVVPSVVSQDELERANSYMQSAELLMLQFLGPPLGGALVAVTLESSFGASALIYGCTALLLSRMGGRFQPQQRQARRSVGQELREGLAFLWRHALLRPLALTTGTLNVAFGAVLAALPLYAVAPGPMGLSSAGYGALMMGTGIGGLIAAPLTAWLQSWLGASRLLLLSVAGAALGFAIPALTSSPFLVGMGLVLTGTAIFWNIVTVSLRQRIVPDHLLGRVNASYRLFAYGALPVGAAAGGLIGELWGLRAVFALSAALVVSTLPPLALLAGPRRLTLTLAQGRGDPP